jgi:glucose-6-phosphate 1-dehydrogenase
VITNEFLSAAGWEPAGGLRAGRDPVLIVVLGATGDLMQRKLLPALYHIASEAGFHPRTRILAAARPEMDDRIYRTQAHEVLRAGAGGGASLDRWCDECLFYQPIQNGSVEDYRALARRIGAIESEQGLSGNRVFYLALPPQAFPEAITGLGEGGLSRSPGWTRVVIEKPFGRDLATAQELNQLVHRSFQESQVYRIDHYLGKETVQNLLAFRFANPIFEQTGALRDIVQNHLTQLVSLVGMDAPVAFDADAIRDEKVKVVRAIVPIASDDVVLGQYAPGEMDGKKVPGYRGEDGVALDSQVETFAALKLDIATWRWHGVPFYLRTGKRLARRVTQIVVTFRRAPIALFQPFHTHGVEVIPPNRLIITVQPFEGFDLYFQVKAPGQEIALDTQPLHFRYEEAYAPLHDAYETLLLDVFAGDQTLFVRADEVEQAWRVYAPLLGRLRQVHPYAAGTWGPAEADRLPERTGHQWFSPAAGAGLSEPSGR